MSGTAYAYDAHGQQQSVADERGGATPTAAKAAVAGIAAARTGKAGVKSLWSHHHDIRD